MDSYELLLFAARKLDEMQVAYLVTGSMATMTYGEVRFTNDVDIVADFREEHVDAICEAFPTPEFYCSRPAVEDAIRRRFQFNVIHPTSGLKIDFMVPREDPFNESRLSRGQQIQLDDDGNAARFASAEDAILKKLQYFQEGGSEKHLRDILGVLAVQGDTLDISYLRKWAAHLNVADELEQVLQ
jgi:hypothetical protein